MSSQVQGVIILVFGVVSITFATTFGARASAFQKRVFGVDISPRFLELSYLIGGIIFSLVGALALLGVVHLAS
jgi:hypothetical protein